jgi:hypothetical protein
MMIVNPVVVEDASMDPVTMIVSAIAMGAAAGLTDTASAAVQDAYAALKGLITGRYPGVDVAAVENKPESTPKRESLVEDLREAGAKHDADLVEAARQVIAAVKATNAGVGPALGIDLEGVEAAALRIRSVTSDGTGVRVRDGTFTGDIDIGDVRAGGAGSQGP